MAPASTDRRPIAASRNRVKHLTTAGVDYLLPVETEGLPEALAAANVAAHEALERLQIATREQARLRSEANGAPEFDRRAAAAAAVVGEDPPPLTAPRLRQKLADAERNRTALSWAYGTRVAELHDLFAEHHPAYLEDRGARAAAAAGAVTALVDQLKTALIDLQRETGLYRAARRYGSDGYRTGSLAAKPSRGAGKGFLDRVERTRGQLRQRSRKGRLGSLLDPDLSQVLAALMLLVEWELDPPEMQKAPAADSAQEIAARMKEPTA